MTIIQALILGLIQGVASFLPVSSSGNVVMVSAFMGANAAVSLKYLALLHIGTLAGLVFACFPEILGLWRALCGMCRDAAGNIRTLFAGLAGRGKGEYVPVIRTSRRKFCVLLLVSTGITIPVALLFRPFAENTAGNLLVTAMGFFVTALILIVSAYSRNANRKPANTKYRDAVVIGAMQGVSCIPGVSRLGMAMAGGSFFGFGRKYMTQYAMLLGIPAIVGGLLLESGQNGVSVLTSVGAGPCVIGILAAAVSGCFFGRITRRTLSRSMNRFFAGYCIAAGVLSIVAYFTAVKG